MSSEKATFGMGCFWGAEEIFRVIKGVISTTVGYMGGTLANPTYEDVCTDKTGHIEVVQIEYDPSRISYKELLEIFWGNHNPTTLNRQGPDFGTQYRSVIFFHTKEQEEEAKRSKEALEKSKRFKRPIVTDIIPASTFYRAEEYHQKYLQKKGLRICHI
jgi:peptide-methionine (S)-S-oxide reductase